MSATSLQQQTNGAKSRTASPQYERAQGVAFLAEIEKYAPWEVWADKLANRKRPRPLRKLAGSAAGDPLRWSCDASNTATTSLVKQLASLRRTPSRAEPADWAAVASEWLDQVAGRDVNRDLGIECLAWSHALSRLATRLPSISWWDLFAYLMNSVSEATAVRTDPDRPDPVLTQLFAAELPLALGYWFWKIEPCRELAHQARNFLSESLVEMMDGEGFLHAQYMHDLREYLACWTRSLLIDKHMAGRRIRKAGRLQFEWLVRQSLRLLCRNGRFVFADRTGRRVPPGMMRAALDVAGDSLDEELYEIHCGRVDAQHSQYELPHAGVESEWSGMAVLRSDWTSKAAVLGVDFSQSSLASELTLNGNEIWHGCAHPEIQVAGRPLRSDASWSELCWYQDKDVDYLELELPMPDGWRLQRQFLLARDDRFLYIADAVIGEAIAPIEYQFNLPFVESLQLMSDDEYHEERVFGRRELARVFPLCLPEWRTAAHAGSYRQGTLSYRANATAIYVPVFVDLDARRQRQELTWRKLTVADQRRIVADHEASAVRVQIGKRQWVFYRSLTRPANRTFLGLNVMIEFAAGSFAKDGEFTSLVEIE